MSNYEFWDELGKIFNHVVAYQEKSIEFNKRFINPWIRLGNVFDQQDRHREAVNAYQKAVEIDPGNAQNWCDLGTAYFRTEAYDQAIHAFKQAIELNPQFGWPYSNLALIFSTQGDHEQAILLYKMSIDLLHEKKDKAVSWNRLGNLYRKLNEYDLAVQAFQKADELDHENAGFRDELDEAPAGALSASSDAPEGSEQSLEAIASPIQLIVEESQAEEAALSAAAEGLTASSRDNDELAGEGGEDLPKAPVEAESQPVEAAHSELLDPVQSPEQLGRLPEELVFEPSAGVPADGSDVAPQAVEARSAEQLPAEPVAEAAGAVPDVVETFTESLIVTDTTTETSDLSAAAAPKGVEAPAVPEEAAATPAEPVTGVAQEAISEPVEPAEVAADLSPELTVVVEVAVEATSKAVEVVEAAPEITAEVSQNVEAAAEAAPQMEKTSAAPEEAADEPVPAAFATKSAVLETIADAGTVSPEPQSPAEELFTAEPARVEAALLQPAAENTEDETDVLQHAAYEEFLKDDSKVLNTMPDIPAQDTLPIEVSPVTEEPATRIDASGEFQIAMDTKNAHVWNELGNVYFNNGAMDDAVVAYSKAIELDRWFAWPYSNLALAYVQKGRFAEAVLLYQRSIELFQSEKDKAVSWNRLGNVYRRMNDYDSAIAAYQRADELDPGNTTLSLQSRFSLLGNFQVEQNASLLA